MGRIHSVYLELTIHQRKFFPKKQKNRRAAFTRKHRRASRKVISEMWRCLLHTGQSGAPGKQIAPGATGGCRKGSNRNHNFLFASEKILGISGVKLMVVVGS